MIKEFKDIRGETDTNVKSNLYIKVELVNDSDLIDPTVRVVINDGNIESMTLMDGQSKQGKYTLNEVEQLQVLVYMGKLPQDKLGKIMFGGN